MATRTVVRVLAPATQDVQLHQVHWVVQVGLADVVVGQDEVVGVEVVGTVNSMLQHDFALGCRTVEERVEKLAFKCPVL